jgi:hypothetical protein
MKHRPRYSENTNFAAIKTALKHYFHIYKKMEVLNGKQFGLEHNEAD